MKNKPLVAVWMVCYNQGDYIADAIESVLSQKTLFNVKLFIGEDCSTDNTKEVCVYYKNKYPDNIELFSNESNLGAMKNALQVYEACFSSGAKYLAMLEGDDYWTSPLKLQTQIDFLEAHQDYSICFHNSSVINGDNKIVMEKFSDFKWMTLDTNIDTYNVEDLIKGSLCPTASVVFKIPTSFQLPYWFSTLPFGDMPLLILVAGSKKVKYLDQIWAVYRRYETSLTQNATPYTFELGLIAMYLYLYKDLPRRYRSVIIDSMKKRIRSLDTFNRLDLVQRNKIRLIAPLFYLRQVLKGKQK